jgi:hypothetical protein
MAACLPNPKSGKEASINVNSFKQTKEPVTLVAYATAAPEPLGMLIGGDGCNGLAAKDD